MRYPVIAVLSFAAFTACQQQSPSAQTTAPAKAESPFKLTAGIKDIMAFEVDPSADALWDSVSTLQTKKGLVEKRPKTEEDWRELRGRAIVLTEAANLLMMDGRRVAPEGWTGQIEDHGTPGNLTAEQSQKAIDENRQTFLSFATALHDVGAEMLKAIDEKNADRLMDAGATMDNVCEGCHLKFWYPGQKIPLFPDQAPEEDLPQYRNKK